MLQYLMKSRNNYKTMKSNMTIASQAKVSSKNRLSSASIISRKIRALDNPIASHKKSGTFNVFPVKNATIKTAREVQPKKYVPVLNQIHNSEQYQKLKILKAQWQTKRVSKTEDQMVLLKNADKTRLIYWNEDFPFQGSEKYVVVSADFLIDQDCFWEKSQHSFGDPHQAQFINRVSLTSTLSGTGTIKGNSCSVRESNIRKITNSSKSSKQSKQPQKRNFSTNGNSSIAANNLISALSLKSNPLLSCSSSNSFVKEWKKLHQQDAIGRQKQNIFVIWIVRKKSAYQKLLQACHTYGLSVHAIYFTKHKRQNQLYDLNPILREIYERKSKLVFKHCQEQLKVQKESTNELFSKKHPISTIANGEECFKSITNKVSLSDLRNKTTEPIDAGIYDNFDFQDENDLNSINRHTSSGNFYSQVDLEKEKIKRDHKVTAMILEENEESPDKLTASTKPRVTISRSLNRKTKTKISTADDSSQNGAYINKGTTKISSRRVLRNKKAIEKQSAAEVESQQSVSTKAHNNNTTLGAQQEQNSIEETDGQLKQIPYYLTHLGEVFTFDVLKCNRSDRDVIDTFSGKMPFSFQSPSNQYTTLIEKLSRDVLKTRTERITQIPSIKQSSDGVQKEKRDENGSCVRSYYLRTEYLKPPGLAEVNSLLRAESFGMRIRKLSSQVAVGIRPLPQINQFITMIAQDIKSHKSDREDFRKAVIEEEKIGLTEAEESDLHSRCQERMEKTRKDIIDRIISQKGRHFQFSEGQSIYYYVGDMIKRNYDLMYEAAYQELEKEVLVKKRRKSQVTKKTQFPPKEQNNCESEKLSSEGLGLREGLHFEITSRP